MLVLCNKKNRLHINYKEFIFDTICYLELLGMNKERKRVVSTSQVIELIIIYCFSCVVEIFENIFTELHYNKIV